MRRVIAALLLALVASVAPAYGSQSYEAHLRVAGSVKEGVVAAASSAPS